MTLTSIGKRRPRPAVFSVSSRIIYESLTCAADDVQKTLTEPVKLMAEEGSWPAAEHGFVAGNRNRMSDYGTTSWTREKGIGLKY